MNIKEKLRDKTRDDLSKNLNLLNIKTNLAERGKLEEDIGKPTLSKGLGIININDTPIKWINIRRRPRGRNNFIYMIDYVIPDLNMKSKFEKIFSEYGNIYIRSKKRKSFPIFGKPLDLRWQVKTSTNPIKSKLDSTIKSDKFNYRIGFISRIFNDNSIKKTIMDTQDIEIRSYNEHNCWLIRIHADRNVELWKKFFNKIFKFKLKIVTRPSKEQWLCYQKIANEIISDNAPFFTQKNPVDLSSE